ncbi:hypothetical protein GCM10009676_13180 [Prauserella halophila]|uniref:Uncharacterized protein n=1 Tax=Prauserella halophila TaxID=185641 RepID=A0ABP4GNQ3_9PSEU
MSPATAARRRIVTVVPFGFDWWLGRDPEIDNGASDFPWPRLSHSADPAGRHKGDDGSRVAASAVPPAARVSVAAVLEIHMRRVPAHGHGWTAGPFASWCGHALLPLLFRARVHDG